METETPALKKEGRFLGLRLKLLLIFSVLFTVVFLAVFYWFYTFAEEITITRVRDDLTSTLLGGAALVNGDELVALAQTGVKNADGFSDDPRMTNQLNWLNTIHTVEPRAWPFLYIPGTKENEIIYIVDLQVMYDKKRAAGFQEAYVSKKGFVNGGLKQLTLNTTNGVFTDYTDKYGRWVSAYAPVKNSKGEIIGGMGIDFEASYVDQVRTSVSMDVIIAFLISFTVLFLMVFFASGTIARPVVHLTRVAEQIGEGKYEVDIATLTKSRLKDEINILAQVFEIMVAKVYQREQTLRHQVEELKIEIDEAKRHSEVGQIVESDFFRELQSKAQQMRSRPAHRAPAPSADSGTAETGAETAAPKPE
jgi:HAMP domain-containing protein